MSEPRLIINQRSLGYAMTGQGQFADGPASLPDNQLGGPIDRWQRCGPLSLDFGARWAYWRQTQLPITRLEFAYLATLALRAPACVGYTELVHEATFRWVNEPGARELAKYHIHQLRDAFQQVEPEANPIISYRGRGYAYAWRPSNRLPADAGLPAPGRRLTLGVATLDPGSSRIWRGAEPVHVPAKTFLFLLALARHAPAMVDFVTLLAEATGQRLPRAQARAQTAYHVHALRRVVERDSTHPELITNVRARGFALLVDPATARALRDCPLAAAGPECRPAALGSSPGGRPAAQSLAVGDLLVQFKQYRVLRSGVPVRLAPSSIDVLRVLAQHMPEPVEATTLAAEALGREEPKARAQLLIQRQVYYLRRALRDYPALVITHPRHGYALGVTPAAVPDRAPDPDELRCQALRVASPAENEEEEDASAMPGSPLAAGARCLQSEELPRALDNQASQMLTRGDISIDLAARKAYRCGAEVPLPPTTFEYLAVLARRAPAVVDYLTLAGEALGRRDLTLSKARDLCKWQIHELREALELQRSRPRWIVSQRGRGYALRWIAKQPRNNEPPEADDLRRRGLRAAGLAKDDERAAPSQTETPTQDEDRWCRINGLTLDLLNQTVVLDDHPVRLSLAEFAYLAVLARQAPNVVDYVSLVKQARGDRDIDRNTARALCKHYSRALRQALDLGQSRSCLIISYRGVGFALTGPGLAPASGATPGDQPQETTGGGERRGPLSLDCGR